MELKKDYSWHDEAHEINKVAIDKEDHEIGVTTGCVGSGKTFVGFDTLKQFIENHPNDKTFQFFVGPRISLVQQQLADAKRYFAGEFTDANPKKFNVKCVEYDCQSDDEVSKGWPTRDEEFIGGIQHVIYFICDKSLWGDEETERKWNAILDNNEQFGRLNGCIVYDEGHNYDNHQENIFGGIVYAENN